MSHDIKSIRKIRKLNVNKAIELIKNDNEKKKHNGMKKDAINHKIALYCNQVNRKRKRISVVGFAKSVGLLEMQLCVARQDWTYALNLFSKLLEYPIEIEPVIWRYAFIILLHMNNPSYLHQFFNQCINNQNLNNSNLLQRLLLLPLQEKEKLILE